MILTYRQLIFLLFALPPMLVLAEPIVVFRHALAPGVGDPAGFELTDCQTQRNLSEQGRQQAIEMGEKLRELGIVEADVFSSEWCRCLETAELLGFGAPKKTDRVKFFFSLLKSPFKKNSFCRIGEHT